MDRLSQDAQPGPDAHARLAAITDRGFPSDVLRFGGRCHHCKGCFDRADRWPILAGDALEEYAIVCQACVPAQHHRYTSLHKIDAADGI